VPAGSGESEQTTEKDPRSQRDKRRESRGKGKSSTIEHDDAASWTLQQIFAEKRTEVG
jgi:hypothetical protein